jgi:tetratricopeptide (TPR) repeat protein
MKAARKDPGSIRNPRDEKRGTGARDWLLALGLLAAVLLAYQPAWNGKPVWDDDAHLIGPGLQSWNGLERIWFQPGATQQYYPLVYSVFWLEQKLWGAAPAGYHLVNILLHLASALLLVRVLRRLEAPGAWLGAALWALHPVQAESVAWMSELKNTLSGLCYLGSALAYLRFDQQKKGAFYLVSLGLFGAGLLAKSVIATLPAALLLAFWWKRNKLRWKEEIAPLAPFFMVGIGLGLFTAWMERAMVMGTDPVAAPLSLLDRCLIPGRAIWFYLGKLAWPHPLIFIYPRWAVSGAVWWQYLFPVAALLLAAGLWHWRRRLGVGPLVALFFFAGTLFLALGFVDVFPFRFSFVADHFQYLACLGPLALAGAGIERGLGWAARRRRLFKPVCCAGLLAILGALTWVQCGQYADAETLWRATLARNPGAWLAHDDLGVILLDQARIADAAAQFQMALDINPDDAVAHDNLGYALSQQGEAVEAIAHYRKALALQPDYAYAHNNLGLALIRQGEAVEAITHFREALSIQPDFRQARENLGFALLRKGDFDGAMACLEKTTVLPSDPVEKWFVLGKEMFQEGHLMEAIACYRQTLSIRPGFAEAWTELGMACFNSGQAKEAVESWQKALDLNPAQPQVQNNLASVLATASDSSLRNGPRAVALALQANQLTGGENPVILCTLAAAYAEAGRYAEAAATARKALGQAEAQKNDKLAGALQEQIRLYEAGRPMREVR